MTWFVLAFGIALAAGLALALATKGSKVHRRELASGVVQPLQAFLDWWDSYGPFDIRIAGNDAASFVAPGGVRNDEDAQRRAYETGQSKARTLSQTAHGRGGAIDVWPLAFDPRVPWEQQPALIKGQFATIGAIATARGFIWGGNWLSLGGGHGDQPHIEVKGWQSLPFPPRES